MDKQINTEIMPRIGNLDGKISNFEKYIESSLESNTKAISDVRIEVANSIQEKLKPTEDKIENMDATIEDVNKIIGIFETRHVETKEKIKEISTVTKNINTQMKIHEQKIIEQSTNDLNKIREQLSDIEVKARFSGQKIEELDTGSQTLQEKVSTIENQMAERLQDLANSDASLSARIDGIELNNNQSINQLTSNLEKSLSSNTTALESRMNNIDTDTKNNALQIVNIKESINIQSEHVKKMDAERQQSEIKAREDLEGTVADNKRAIAELRNELLECVSEKIQPTENKVRDIDSEIHVINKTVSVMESRHVETVQKLKEVTVITNNVQTQVQAQEQKMVEQSANELNQVRDQIQDIENRTSLSDREIETIKKQANNLSSHLEILNAGNQELNEKLNSTKNDLGVVKNATVGLEKDLGGHVKRISDLEKTELSNSSEIKILSEASSRYYQHIQALEILSDKVSNMEDNQDRSQTKLKIELIDNITKNIEEMKKFCASTIDKVDDSLSIRVTHLEDGEKDIIDKIEAIQDFAYRQEEKTRFVETLSSRVNKMDEMRQQSEAKTSQELEVRASRNALEIQELRRNLELTLSELERNMKEETRSIKSDNAELKRNGDSLMNQLDSVVDGFEKDVTLIKSEQEAVLHNQHEKITTLISSKEEHSKIFERISSDITKIETRLTSGDQKTKAIAENLLITSEGQFTEMKHYFEGKINELLSITNEHGEMFEQQDDRLAQIIEQARRFQQDLLQTNKEVDELKRQGSEDRELVVIKHRETRDTLQSFFESLETIQSTQNQESSRVEIIAKQTASQERLASQLEEKISKMEKFGEEQNSLILAVERTAHAKVTEMETELQSYVNNSQQDLRNIRTTVDCDRAGLWGGLVELFSAFRGYTVVIKSEGAVKVHQADVLGVYRMMDSYNDRPVYKQDGGENYIYYSAASNTWFVGTVVGHQYGWLRNGSEAASSNRWIPDLSSGWEYRPLVRSAATIGHNTWLSDDGTLRIESLRDVDRVKEVIQEMRSQRNVQ